MSSYDFCSARSHGERESEFFCISFHKDTNLIGSGPHPHYLNKYLPINKQIWPENCLAVCPQQGRKGKRPDALLCAVYMLILLILMTPLWDRCSYCPLVSRWRLCSWSLELDCLDLDSCPVIQAVWTRASGLMSLCLSDCFPTWKLGMMIIRLDFCEGSMS